MATKLYDSQRWRDYRSRVLADDAECAFARLAGDCSGALQVHHVEPLADGGPPFPARDGVVVLCVAHHSWLHGWKRRKKQTWKRCPHHHVTPEGRRLCERRLNRVAA
jgi:hypothetical protein